MVYTYYKNKRPYNRITMEYPKINTLFKRDENNLIMPSMYSSPVFEYLKDVKWECTEKVDGTNIRIEVSGKDVTLCGRTSKAIIPPHLLKYLKDTFTKETVFKALGIDPLIGVNEGTEVTIYGEGYGAKIQNGGNYIKNGVGFILFDVKIGKWWLERKTCEELASNLGVKIVPLIGYYTLQEAIDYVKGGFLSKIAENKEYLAEGFVLKTQEGLLTRDGSRIITKLKTMDFVKYNNYIKAHPEYKQVLNTNYETTKK